MKKRLLILCLGAAVTLSFPNARGEEKEKKKPAVDTSKLPPASDKKDVTYAADIRPIFDHSCIKCHGEQKPKGKLRLDSLEGVLKGGVDGKVVEPGNSAGSILVRDVAHLADEVAYMPPPDNKDKIPPLTKEQIGLIRAWIDQGPK